MSNARLGRKERPRNKWGGCITHITRRSEQCKPGEDPNPSHAYSEDHSYNHLEGTTCLENVPLLSPSQALREIPMLVHGSWAARHISLEVSLIALSGAYSQVKCG